MCPVLVIVLGLLVHTVSSVVVNTQYGQVRGRAINMGGKNTAAFTGIPYAAPPTGENRFKVYNYNIYQLQ